MFTVLNNMNYIVKFQKEGLQPYSQCRWLKQKADNIMRAYPRFPSSNAYESTRKSMLRLY